MTGSRKSRVVVVVAMLSLVALIAAVGASASKSKGGLDRSYGQGGVVSGTVPSSPPGYVSQTRFAAAPDGSAYRLNALRNCTAAVCTSVDALYRWAPDGVHAVFDNVWGEVSARLVERLRPLGRVALCGQMSGIADAVVPPLPLDNWFRLVTRSLTVQGFRAADFAADRICPLHRTVVVRQDVLDRYPELPGLLFDRFVATKRSYLERLATADDAEARGLRQLTELVGPDPLPYGRTANLPSITELADLAKRDGLLAPDVDPRSMFLDLDPTT